MKTKRSMQYFMLLCFAMAMLVTSCRKEEELIRPEKNPKAGELESMKEKSALNNNTTPDAWAVSEGLYVYRFDDATKTWKIQNTGTLMKSVSCGNGVVWGIGLDDAVYRCIIGEGIWEKRCDSPANGETFHHVSGYTKDIVIASTSDSKHIYRSSNGGISWDIAGISFTDSDKKEAAPNAYVSMGGDSKNNWIYYHRGGIAWFHKIDNQVIGEGEEPTATWTPVSDKVLYLEALNNNGYGSAWFLQNDKTVYYRDRMGHFHYGLTPLKFESIAGTFDTHFWGIDNGDNVIRMTRSEDGEYRGVTYNPPSGVKLVQISEGKVVISIETLPATSITASSATVGGAIVDDGGSNIIERGIMITSDPSRYPDAWYIIAGTGQGAYSVTKDNLNSNCRFYYWAYAKTSDNNIVYGEMKSFSTSIDPDDEIYATFITQTSVVIKGRDILDNGLEITERGLCWKTGGSAPTIHDDKIGIGLDVGSFSKTINNLLPASTYNIRSYAIHSNGVVYGNLKSFETLPTTIPQVTTNYSVLPAGQGGGLLLNGFLVSDGGFPIIVNGEKQCGYLVSTNSTLNINNYDEKISVAPIPVFSNQMMYQYNPSTTETIYIRAFATNSLGTGYGEIMSYTP